MKGKILISACVCVCMCVRACLCVCVCVCKIYQLHKITSESLIHCAQHVTFSMVHNTQCHEQNFDSLLRHIMFWRRFWKERKNDAERTRKAEIKKVELLAWKLLLQLLEGFKDGTMTTGFSTEVTSISVSVVHLHGKVWHEWIATPSNLLLLAIWWTLFCFTLIWLQLTGY